MRHRTRRLLQHVTQQQQYDVIARCHALPHPCLPQDDCASITYTTRLQFEMNGYFYVLQWSQLADIYDRTNRTWTVFVPTIDGFMNVIRQFAISSGR